MAHKALLVALGAIMATSVSAAQPEGAPAASPEARYCLWVEPHTGSRLETIECWTREEWAEAGVDVDKEWAKEGVKVLA